MSERLNNFNNQSHDISSSLCSLFSLDVEGAEYEVLKSINFEVVTFDLIIVEADRSNVEKDTNVRNLLEKNGYSFVNNEGRSDWFKRAGWTPTPC